MLETANTQTGALAGTMLSKTERVSLPPGTILGQYELIREIGNGGMGVVYLARDTRLGRLVAIKLVARKHESWARRFVAEARTTARCTHDNIVIIHDVGETQDCLYMVLEYLEGITLRAWLDARRRAREPPAAGTAANQEFEALFTTPQTSTQCSPSLAIQLMIPVVRALVHAHGLGLVHRDLKPENIMLTDGGALKVLDFGIAKVLDGDPKRCNLDRDFDSISPGAAKTPWSMLRFDTGVDRVVGTVAYMSPEQWNGEEVDERSDLWAVGIMLWELATGDHPLAPLSFSNVEVVRDIERPMPSLADASPAMSSLASIVDHCLRKRRSERIPSAQALLSGLESLLPGRAPSVSALLDEPDNPYTGLATFQESDATRFFGRDRDIASIVAQLRHHRLIAVAGSSGAGKSSFVRAGVIPALKRLDERWEIVTMRPGRDPLHALSNVLVQTIQAMPAAQPELDESGAVDPNALREMLRAQPGYLGTILRTYCYKQRTRLLIYVDQFEELYTLSAIRDIREAFVRCLEGVADDEASPLRVLVSLRSDFLDRVAEDRSFTSAITRALVLLPNLGRPELREALVRPLETTGYEFESEELIESMLDALLAAQAPLPILQFTAARLWETRDIERRLITTASYDKLGGIAGALASHANAVLAGMSAGEQQLARLLFTSLVTPERTRAIVSLDELHAFAPSDDAEDGCGAMEQVVQELAMARLVTIDRSLDHRSPMVELTHESLISGWPKIRQWLDEDEKESAFCMALRAAAREWDRQGRSEDLLWRGQAADETRRWFEHWHDTDGDCESGMSGRGAGTRMPALSARDRDYMREVIARAARASRRRRQRAAASFVFLGAVAVVVSLLALRARQAATRADREASHAREESVQTRNAVRLAVAREHHSDPTFVLSLVRELEPSQELPGRWENLARWALHEGIAEVVLTHPSLLHMAVFSPDGDRIAIASNDGIARVWNADGTGEPLLLQTPRGRLLGVAFSPDGNRIVTVSSDTTARIWNADGTGEPIVLEGHSAPVQYAAFSPDGTRIVTASEDKTARIWNADGTGEPIVLEGHEGYVMSAAFSPDGARIVTASEDRTARVWNADGTGPQVILRGHTKLVGWAAFSPDGTRIVTASWDGSARVWNADGTETAVVLAGHDGKVYAASFSPDGTRVATASLDKTARVWSADGTGQPRILVGHQGGVRSVAWRPDGTRILTASTDKTARVWRADGADESISLLGHDDRIYSVAFSRDGARIITASEDRTARVWNSDGTGEPLVFRGHRERVSSAAFSPDGTRIVTASWDDTARVWNVDGAGQPVVLAGHQDNLWAAAFSPDGTRVVTGSEDRTARVWSADGTGQPIILAGHEEKVSDVEFSRDGTRVVTASWDGTARVWNADGTGQPIILAGHRDRIFSVAFSPDGTSIATGASDHTVRIWNADGTGHPIVLEGHETAINDVGFSPDGARVVSISGDKTIRIWNADGTGHPMILNTPEINAWSVAFSPDGKRIVSASHARRRGTTKKTVHLAKIWPDIAPLSGTHEPRLWTATSFCPPVEQRMELLGVSTSMARQGFAVCQRRVAAARAKFAP